MFKNPLMQESCCNWINGLIVVLKAPSDSMVSTPAVSLSKQQYFISQRAVFTSSYSIFPYVHYCAKILTHHN